ncbi:MAG: DNA mismatch repair protein MutS, partial [Dehalococcoidales bacterium]|nr:DNA mismatch repair protein MutS [Dehalococcoidales bacterium]
RRGDFYETFDEDAKIASRELEIVLTSREMGKGNKVPLAGIPYHALDNYLARLINRGYKVAICEQMAKPGETKGMLPREVIRLVTPGTVVEPGLLDSKSNNYLAAVAVGESEAGLAFVDITTSEFQTTQLPIARLAAELARLKPAEIIIAKGAEADNLAENVTRVDDYWFEAEAARQALLDHFAVATLDGYGCAHLPLAVAAAGAIVRYLSETQKASLGQLMRLATYSTESYMALDAQTKKNLEIFQGARSGTAEGSLLSVLDATKTPMGGRLLKRWLGQPLLDITELNKRQDAVGWFAGKSLARSQIISLLGGVADLERLINRIRSEIAIPRELVSLRRSLEAVPKLKEVFDAEKDGIDWLRDELKAPPEVVELIAGALVEEPSSTLGEGESIKPGFSAELDSLRLAAKNARQYLAGLENRERERTGIKSLKIGFNNVFGYYIEISNANIKQAPPEYIRKQTLVNGERYFTQELKEYESVILNARERIGELETNLFRQVCRQVAAFSERILILAETLARLDVFLSLAEVAVSYRYVRPVLNEGSKMEIRQGRHPVVERSLVAGSFTANDTALAGDDAQLIVLTGPNMSGKSTYLRQVALIVLMAQTGSFVPADSAAIGVVDRIFTRIGARDDLAAGQSTFMVEMVETANILNNATPRSLLILDEIGRGTSTYDGLAIARAVAEYIHNSPRLGARTLFATHYHEMVALANSLPRVRNFNVAVIEEAGKVIFLHKIVPGGVDKSYGIHVAQLAGLPRPVLQRAREVLDELEADSRAAQEATGHRHKEPAPQIPLFGQKSALEEELAKLDINALTPLEALNKLYELQKKVK